MKKWTQQELKLANQINELVTILEAKQSIWHDDREELKLAKRIHINFTALLDDTKF